MASVEPLMLLYVRLTDDDDRNTADRLRREIENLIQSDPEFERIAPAHARQEKPQ